MTVITLPPEIEQTVAERAKQQGTTTELLVLDSLRRLFPSTEEIPEEPPEAVESATLYDFLQGFIGTVDGSSEAFSEHCGERFAEGMAEKQKAGKL